MLRYAVIERIAEEEIPLGRAAEPEHILYAAIFLASEASSHISGVIIPVANGPEFGRPIPRRFWEGAREEAEY